MADQSFESKTEAPTPRRREHARAEGQVVYSGDLQTSMQLLAGAGLLTLGGEWFVSQLASILTGYLSLAPAHEWTAAQTVQLGQGLALDVQRLCLPLVAVLLTLGILVAVVQAGPLVLVPIKLKWDRLDPVSGWNRLFSQETVVRGLMAIAKAALIAAVAAAIVSAGQYAIASAGFHTFQTFCGEAWSLSRRLLLMLSGVGLGIGVVDFGFRWYRHEQQLKMSRQELKDDHKEDSGDPHIRARIRRLQQQAAMAKGLKDVPKATVVLTNPTHLAIAIRYEHGVTSAPVVLAKGEGAIALRIRRIAEQHKIPIQERKPLVRALYKLVDVGQEIPVEFYRAIAEILSAIYRMRGIH